MKFIYSSLGSSVFFLGIHCLTNQFNEQLSVFLLAQLAVRVRVLHRYRRAGQGSNLVKLEILSGFLFATA